MTEKATGFLKLFKKENKATFIFIAGIIGLLLIFISGFIQPKDDAKSVSREVSVISNQEYISEIENKLCLLLSGIQGVGKVSVMVTINQGTEYVYASEDKTNSDKYQDFEGEQTKKVQYKATNENNLVLVDDSKGNAQPVISTQIEPTVKGVVVVCDGASNSVVCSRISEAITTV
ncbi:MAG: hypothetical protein RRZ73_06480, partial [Oscillospiraceae bacterium]